MRIGIVADIHGNLPAFERVLARLKEYEGVDRLVCLGDVVGYGPYPNECLDLLRDQNHICLPGNHDWATVGKAERVVFNDDARWTIDWTDHQLIADHRAYLAGLVPLGELPDAPFTVVHASPREPIWEYIIDEKVAEVCFPFFQTPYCLVGHTHRPAVFRLAADGTVTKTVPEATEVIPWGAERLIVNPGSVGQPRNGDPRAHYAVLDPTARTITFERIEYPILRIQTRMHALNFPPRLIRRLEKGN